MQRKTIARILMSVALLLFVLFMPIWLSVILAIVAIIYFPFYWEATLLFLLSDLLFGAEVAALYNVLFVGFFLSIAFLLIAEGIKKKLKFY